MHSPIDGSLDEDIRGQYLFINAVIIPVSWLDCTELGKYSPDRTERVVTNNRHSIVLERIRFRLRQIYEGCL